MDYTLQYDLFLLLPDVCRATYLASSLPDQAKILEEVKAVVANTVDLDKLKYWEEHHESIQTGSYGTQLESDIRTRVATELEHLGKDGNLLRLPAGLGPVALEIDKNFDCTYSHHFSYMLYLAPKGSTTFAPWIIPSKNVPEIIFEMRIEAYWEPVGHKAEDGEQTPMAIRVGETGKRSGLLPTDGRSSLGASTTDQERVTS